MIDNSINVPGYCPQRMDDWIYSLSIIKDRISAFPDLHTL